MVKRQRVLKGPQARKTTVRHYVRCTRVRKCARCPELILRVRERARNQIRF